MKSLVYRTASVVLSENEFDSGDIEETFGPSSWFCVAAIQNCCCCYTVAAGSFSPAPSGRRLVRSSHTQLVICVPPSPAAGWLARWLAHCSTAPAASVRPKQNQTIRGCQLGVTACSMRRPGCGSLSVVLQRQR